MGERIHFRVSDAELHNLNGIMAAGDFGDKSSTVRFCIHFTNTILSILPAAIGESFIEAIRSNSNEPPTKKE